MICDSSLGTQVTTQYTYWMGQSRWEMRSYDPPETKNICSLMPSETHKNKTSHNQITGTYVAFIALLYSCNLQCIFSPHVRVCANSLDPSKLVHALSRVSERSLQSILSITLRWLSLSSQHWPKQFTSGNLRITHVLLVAYFYYSLSCMLFNQVCWYSSKYLNIL